MPNHKQKIRLTAEQETLLITLYSRAFGCPRSVLDDQVSRDILEHIEYDFSHLKITAGTRLTLCIRAKKIDDYVREFLDSNPGSVVLHLGCGLDSRYTRINKREAEWYDLDVPEVIDLRMTFFEETDRYHMIPSSVTDLRWIDTITHNNSPVLVVAEGLMMYLSEEEVKSLVLKLREEFPGCSLVFDAYSTLTAKHVKRNPLIKQTGAVIKWGIDDARAIERWAEGIRLKEEWNFIQSEEIKKLALRHRALFRLTGLFPVVRRAHRILYYTL